MGELTPQDILKGLNFMLKEDALEYFSNNEGGYDTYDDSLEALRVWYKPSD